MLTAQIKTELTAAMKAGDPLRLSVLRMLSSELNYRQIELQRELTDEDVLAVVGREAKKRREAIEAYARAGRPGSADQEAAELKILQAYLPAQMSEDEVRAEIGKLLDSQTVADFGQAMRIVSPALKGRADGALVASIVKQRLA